MENTSIEYEAAHALTGAGPTTLDLFANKQKSARIPTHACTKGSFWMGHKDDANAPLQLARVHSSFAIATQLVAQELWLSVSKENPSNWVHPQLPVERVSWLEAILFCNRLSEAEGLDPCYYFTSLSIVFDGTKKGYRLPFEVEWEYAARAGSAGEPELAPEYSGGARYENVAHIPSRGSSCKTGPVGSKEPNAWGIYDMTGNLNEWCNDLFEPLQQTKGVRRQLRVIDFDITEQSFELPLELLQDFSRSACVVKGGSWFNSPEYSRVYIRHRQSLLYPSSMVGIRLARSI